MEELDLWPCLVYAAADNPNHSSRQREGQHWDQVCPPALAAASGQVRAKDLRVLQHWVEWSGREMGCLLYTSDAADDVSWV